MDIFGLISNNETLYKYCSECKEYVKSDSFASLQDAHHALEQIVNYQQFTAFKPLAHRPKPMLAKP